MRTPKHSPNQRGFTLLELMTAIAVMAVLLAVGVPAFTNIARNSQIAAESNNLLSALNLAKDESRKGRVSVCAAADAETCSDEPNWSGGYLIFTDEIGTVGTLDEGDTLIQMSPAPDNGVTIDTDTLFVSFNRGAATTEESFAVHKEGCRGDQRREITIEFSGRIELTRSACSSED